MSMRVKHSSVEQVKERIKWNIERKTRERQQKQETIQDRILRYERDFNKRRRGRGGRKVQANRLRKEKYKIFMEEKLNKYVDLIYFILFLILFLFLFLITQITPRK